MTTPTALTAIHRAALNLVTEAQRCGMVVTIDTTPHQPLAMGNHDMSVSVHEARRPPPFAADYSARLGTELLGIVATARAQAKRIIEGTGAPSDLAQDRRDLPETMQVIHHAVQHGLASLTDTVSTDYARELQALRKKVATYEARDALGLVTKAPPAAVTASIMRDEGGEVPAFCLMAAYRTEADVQAACALLGVSISTPQGGA